MFIFAFVFPYYQTGVRSLSLQPTSRVRLFDLIVGSACRFIFHFRMVVLLSVIYSFGFSSYSSSDKWFSRCFVEYRERSSLCFPPKFTRCRFFGDSHFTESNHHPTLVQKKKCFTVNWQMRYSVITSKCTFWSNPRALWWFSCMCINTFVCSCIRSIFIV